VAYGEAFQKRFVPEVENRELVNLAWGGSDFLATFSDGHAVRAKKIIVAVGVHPFAYVPEQLRHLPSELLSHSGEYGPLDKLQGKQVVVLGAGASASGLAALISERGIGVSILARDSELPFPKLPRTSRSLLRRLALPLRPLIYPNSGIGGSWLLKICADTPQLIHALPEALRLHIAHTALGPSGHSSLRERVIGKISTRLGCSLTSAETEGDRLRLRLARREGGSESLVADHVIAATGFRTDLARLRFLKSLLPQIRMVQDTPILNFRYESSVPGLYFAGPATANSFGPVARFAYGAIHPARAITAHIARARAPQNEAAVPLTARAEPTKN
jgi:thioredoxin reductase